jgi:hypothetical protein
MLAFAGAPALAQITTQPYPDRHGRPPVTKPAPLPRPGHGRPPVRPNPGYGNWNGQWGARPPGPPSSWHNNGDWYRHVRACHQKYARYDARTDTYLTRKGSRKRCKL